MEAVDLPGYEYNAIISSRIAQDIYDKFKPKELNDVHVLYLHTHFPGDFIWRDKPVTTLEEFKGKRVRTTGLSVQIVEALGGKAIAMPKGDQYDALQKGLVDGAVSAPNELVGWKMADVSKYTTLVPRVGYVNTMFVVMNKNTWNKLPPDIQQVFTKVSKMWPEYHGKVWNEMEIEGYKHGKANKHTFTTLKGQELARWQKAISKMPEEWVKEKTAKGLPAKEIYEYRQQLIEKYNKMYPPLKFE
jgi:TRAP-type C4-dicarboxylate transport system substrate-binding protein